MTPRSPKKFRIDEEPCLGLTKRRNVEVGEGVSQMLLRDGCSNRSD
jgi:hypothetical protein